jgi:Universal stress protein family
MSGIVVGVDGSGHSQHALVFAMHEATIRHVPLTVLTVHEAVHEAVRRYYSDMAVYADDPARTEDAGVAAQAETDKVLAGLDGPHPRAGHGQGGARLCRRGACSSASGPVSLFGACRHTIRRGYRGHRHAGQFLPDHGHHGRLMRSDRRDQVRQPNSGASLLDAGSSHNRTAASRSSA